MERQTLEVHFVDFLDVLAVVLAQDDVLDAGTLGGEDFLLNAAHGQHLAAQGDFACHSQMVFHLALGEGRSERRYHRHARRRAILGDGALGHMDMDIVLVEQIRVDTQQ